MKLFYVLLSSLFIMSNASAQWQATSVSTNASELVYDITEHNGSLYGAINSKGLIKYNGSTWDSVAVNGFTVNPNSVHIERIISNSNFLYAVVQDQSCASSIIYKSADDGLTFVADTVGLPIQTCDYNPMNVNLLYSDGDYLFLTLNAGISTYRKKPSDASWSLNPAIVNNANRFAGNNDTWYGFYHSLVVSNDFGQTWSSPANNNLPSSNIATGLQVDLSNDRIYLPLEIYSNYGTKLVYTDDEGENWDSLAVNQYLTKDWIGLKTQRIVSMISDGDFIELGLVNNSGNTTPDFLVSNDAGLTFEKDTLGLPNDPWGTMVARNMVIHNNNLYAAVGPDVYKKSLGPVGIDEVGIPTKHVLSPNPTNGLIHISNIQNETISVYNLQGNLLLSQKSADLDLSAFPNGLYLVKIDSGFETDVLRVVKN